MIIGAAGAPAVAFAEQNSAASASQLDLASPLNKLKKAQDTFAKAKGYVADMAADGLAPRQEATAALQQIRSQVARLNSGKVPQELLHDTMGVINEAQTALTTDSAQTIAYSLETVGQQVQAIEAKLSGTNTAQTPAPGETAGKEANLQPQPQEHPAQASAEQPQKVVENQAQPVANTKPESHQEQPNAAAHPANQPQPAPTTTAANQAAPAAAPNAAKEPAAPENKLATMKRGDVVGKQLYDSAGNDVATIQDAKTAPNGDIQAVEVDVGGFLGIGSRRVPVPVDQLQMKGDRITAVSMTADQIRNLPHTQ